MLSVQPSRPDDKQLKSYTYSADMIPLVWDEMEAMLLRSFEHSHGMITKEKLYEWLCSGDAIAMATTKDNRLMMVIVLMKVNYSTYSAIRIVACAGRGLKEAMQFINALESWALTQGCVEIEAWCRPAMVRLVRRLGWLPKTMIVSRDLRRKLQ